MGNIQKRVSALANELNSKLISLENVTVLERSADLSGIVTFQKKGIQASELARSLFERKINTSK
jgi:selenocysteine lyase/cysteine desulfurase